MVRKNLSTSKLPNLFQPLLPHLPHHAAPAAPARPTGLPSPRPDRVLGQLPRPDHGHPGKPCWWGGCCGHAFLELFLSIFYTRFMLRSTSKLIQWKSFIRGVIRNETNSAFFSWHERQGSNHCLPQTTWEVRRPPMPFLFDIIGMDIIIAFLSWLEPRVLLSLGTSRGATTAGLKALTPAWTGSSPQMVPVLPSGTPSPTWGSEFSHLIPTTSPLNFGMSR